MIAEAAARGDLDGVGRLIEHSPGNTVSSQAVAARHFGVERTCSYVIVNRKPPAPEDTDPGTGGFPCPDDPLPHFDEHAKYIDRRHFPEIRTEEFRLNEPDAWAGTAKRDRHFKPRNR